MSGTGRIEIRLNSVVLSEFDNVLGPKIALQTQPWALSSAEFDVLSEFLIAKPFLCGHVVSTPLPYREVTERAEKELDGAAGEAEGEEDEAALWTPGEADLSPGAGDGSPRAIPASRQYIVGLPLSIEHSRYHRNAFLFNIAFVVQPRRPASPHAPIDDVRDTYVFLWTYGGALRKLGRALAELEAEGQWLSDPTKQEAMAAPLAEIREGLQERGESFVVLPSGAVLALQLRSPLLPWAPSSFKNPEGVAPYHVPVAVRDMEALVGHDWDLGIRRLLKFLDGATHIRGMAEAADMALPLALGVVEQLYLSGFVKLIDPFHYSNEYCVTGKVRSLLQNEGLARAALHFFAPEVLLAPDERPQENPSSPATPFLQKPEVRRVLRFLLRLYVAFGVGGTVSSVIQQFPAAFGLTSIDVDADDAVPAVSSFDGSIDGGQGGHGGRERSPTPGGIAASRSGDGAILLRTAVVTHPRGFVTFGTLHGLVRRIHLYPVPREVPDESPTGPVNSPVTEQVTGAQEFVRRYRPWLNGDQPLDAVCCVSYRSRNEVVRILGACQSPTFFIVKK